MPPPPPRPERGSGPAATNTAFPGLGVSFTANRTRIRNWVGEGTRKVPRDVPPPASQEGTAILRDAGEMLGKATEGFKAYSPTCIAHAGEEQGPDADRPRRSDGGEEVVARGVRLAIIVLGLGWSGAVLAALGAAGRVPQEPCAPALLSETGLYEASRPGAIARGVRQFSPQYPLWTDGASKARWIYLPPGTAIDTRPRRLALPSARVFGRTSFQRPRSKPGYWRQPRTVASRYAGCRGHRCVLAPDGRDPGAAEMSPRQRPRIPEYQTAGRARAENARPLGSIAQLSTDRYTNASRRPCDGMTSLAPLTANDAVNGCDPNGSRIAADSKERPETRAILGYFGPK